MVAASDKKLQSFHAFNSGEYSKDLAGRTDLESFATSTRYCSNFLSQVSGGLKKFYGTRHITEKTLESGRSKIKLIPFINKYEPMAFVVYGLDSVSTDGETTGLKVGLVYGNNYRDLSLRLPNTVNVDELRWKQVNDRLILVHKSMQPMSIDFYGVDDSGTEDYIFRTGTIEFSEIPYFPLKAIREEDFGVLQASALSGEITLTVPTSSYVATYLPERMQASATYVRNFPYQTKSALTRYVMDDSYISVYRVRSGVTTTLVSQKKVNESYISTTTHRVEAKDTITVESIREAVQTVYPQAFIDGDKISLAGITGHQNGDQYYMKLKIGSFWKYAYNPLDPDDRTQDVAIIWPSEELVSDYYTPTAITTVTLNADNFVGRRIKIFVSDGTTVDPWWQGKTVASGDYVYSNGHWYKALNAGVCGNVQPSHTYGVRADGTVTNDPSTSAVAWRYVHSGSTTGKITGVPTSSTITVLIPDGHEIPKNKDNAVDNYAFSIWGKDATHPSDVYMVGNRLGFVCNTKNYGSWNAMSVTDDYFNFSTEEYGEQLDTSAIVHLVGNNESSDINWVLARKDVYMGGYSGEYHITPSVQGNRTGAYTPTTTYVQNISNMGGRAIIPLKYKQLNMFVGLTGKELYTVAYDYTIDDYTPKSLGYLTEHIMDRGIKRIEALNNKDRNIYLLHDTKQLSLFNYAEEQKVMGFSELDFGDEVIDFCSTYANSEVAGYVVVKRNDGKITIERFTLEDPNYMFDEIVQGDGTLADFQPITHFANRTVYIRYGDDFSQFTKVELDANGDISHDPLTGVYLPQSKYFKVGIPMVAEMHTQPAFGNKVEGHQQQSLYMYLRLVNSGAFYYGSSVDFNKYFRHEYWNAQQEYGAAHRLFTGDMKLEVPLGYAEAQNQGEGPYPNTSAVGINIKSDTPEPLNILSIQEIYR